MSEQLTFSNTQQTAQANSVSFRVCLDESPRLPNQKIGVDQVAGHRLDRSQLFGVPTLASPL
jgi:hypothetical protein